MKKLVDANIILRYLLADHPQQSSKAKQFLEKIEKGEENAIMTPLAVAEVVYVLESSGASRKKISEALLRIISLRNLQIAQKRIFPEVFSVYRQKNIDFIDAYQAVFAQKFGIKSTITPGVM